MRYGSSVSEGNFPKNQGQLRSEIEKWKNLHPIENRLGKIKIRKIDFQNYVLLASKNKISIYKDKYHKKIAISW